MERALKLAKLGLGKVAPNPMVGCVVVKDDNIISEGYHERYGGYHAERNTLTKPSVDFNGAEMYVTLEPCCHYGKTPPCTDIIIEKGIKRVYVGCTDPNPLVAGQGIKILQNNNIDVITGVMEKECRELNEIFFYFMKNKLPFVALKYAMTVDGKIATASGDSKWVTDEEARKHVHLLRKRYKGIMTGVNTVLMDDPMLNCRIEDGVNPTRIICDSNFRIPLESMIIKTAKKINTIIAYTESALKDEKLLNKANLLKEAGVKLLLTSGGEKVDLNELMIKLAAENIDSILLEGGGTLNASAIEAGIVNKVYAYIAPKIIGGSIAKSPIEGAGIQSMSQAVHLKDISVDKYGFDICISGYIK